MHTLFLLLCLFFSFCPSLCKTCFNFSFFQFILSFTSFVFLVSLLLDMRTKSNLYVSISHNIKIVIWHLSFYFMIYSFRFLIFILYSFLLYFFKTLSFLSNSLYTQSILLQYQYIIKINIVSLPYFLHHSF